MRSLSLAVAAALLIATTAPAGAQELDAAPASDADPGPRLPNGEPQPPPDLIADSGGISCALGPPLVTPLPAAIALLWLLRRRR